MGKAKRVRKARASARAERRQKRRWFGLEGEAREGFAIGLGLAVLVGRLMDLRRDSLTCGACGGRWNEDHDHDGQCFPELRRAFAERERLRLS